MEMEMGMGMTKKAGEERDEKARRLSGRETGKPGGESRASVRVSGRGGGQEISPSHRQGGRPLPAAGVIFSVPVELSE